LRFLRLIPHEKPFGIRRVSNPSTSIDPGSLKIGFLILIQNVGCVRDNGTNQQKRGIGVENLSPKSFLGGVKHIRKTSRNFENCFTRREMREFLHAKREVRISFAHHEKRDERREKRDERRETREERREKREERISYSS